MQLVTLNKTTYVARVCKNILAHQLRICELDVLHRVREFCVSLHSE